MKSRFYTHEQLVNVARLKPEDIGQIRLRRRQHNRLGFGYQLCFVKCGLTYCPTGPLKVGFAVCSRPVSCDVYRFTPTKL